MIYNLHAANTEIWKMLTSNIEDIDCCHRLRYKYLRRLSEEYNEDERYINKEQK
jgi:hypothetical protein